MGKGGKKYHHEPGCGVKASEPCTCEVLVPRKPMWWHVYGGVTTDEHPLGGGCYCMVIFGESTKAPGEMHGIMPIEATPWALMSRLESFDHDPTNEEKAALMPEEYRDND